MRSKEKRPRNRKDALQICLELWTWMRDNSKITQDEKCLWPGWDKYGGVMESACPCCEYVSSVPYCTCDKCPLRSLWPDGCLSSGPYAKFRCAGEGESRLPSAIIVKRCREAAQEIIDGCRRELKRYRRKAKRP